VAKKPKPADFKPISGFPKDHAHRGKPRCQAWNGNHGRQCMAWARKGKKTCRHHGGNTPGGIAAGSWKHGRYSKYIPTGLRSKYDDAISDPEILALDAEIALLQSRLTVLLEKLDRMPDAKNRWQDLQTAYKRFEHAQRAAARLEDGNEKNRQLADASESLGLVGDIIGTGVFEWAAWGEIVNLTDSLRKLSESEQKRRVAGQHMIYMEQVWNLFEYLVNLIDDNVADKRERAKLSEGLHRFSRRMDGAEALVGKERK
jgi:hypothetical protein